VRGIDEIRSGLMHSTYGIEAAEGRFVLQRLHRKLSTPEIIGDYEAVTAHLHQKTIEAPRLVRTRDDRPVAIDDSGRWWRLSTWVEGETRNRVTSTQEAEQGARALGRFHRAMADTTHNFESQHPLHDTEGHLARLESAVENPMYGEALQTIKREIEFILRTLPTLLLPETLPRRVVHGDPKISNVLFRDDLAVGLIDLDTCNRHTILVDLGDATRSWCRDGSEDEQQHFQLDRFEAIMRGYAAEGPPLDHHELDWLGRSGRLITMELASRFARDVLEDEYFAFDSDRYSDRSSHNRARARGMLFMAADMGRQSSEIEALVNRYFRS
jgi:Ser/Thr protein kinase RdoA (MazF antagonist)